MDRKEDDQNPPGSSRRKKKRELFIDSPHLERKKIRISMQKERLDTTKTRNPPADETFTNVASFRSSKSNCGSETDSETVSVEGDSDSTDSDCAVEQPSLLEQLKTILDNYQDAQIILELIQNADDANATEMQIIYVNDTEETTSGHHKQCGCYSEYFRVPALCVYNNAVFKKDDWKYIKSIYRSGKREDALKVGRYGLGFKSVFHMTDNPVIISGDQLLIIDPFRTKNKLGNDCHTLKFKKLKKAVQKKRHYKQAIVAMETLYDHCGFTKESLKDGYHGTLFWFPLRRSASKLSTKVFNHRDVKELIAMFKKEAPCLPLFLKNITQVSFHNKDELFSSFSVTCSVAEEEEKASFHIKLAACKGRSPEDDIKAIFPANVTVKDGKEVKTQRWVVCNYVKGLNSLSGELRTLAENKLSYSPFVGIAVPIGNTSGAKFQGHVFCFLPLPSTGENYTGLPVHINGFFALSQDRHHVKWPTDDQTEREDEAQRWNRFLCEEVIVDAYTNTLDYMKKLTVRQKCMESDNLVYKILPLRPNVRPNWNTIIDPLYRSLKNKDVFYSKINGGKWVQSKDAVFSILKWNEDRFINVRETEQCIVDLLLDCQRNVVNVPSHVADMFPDVARITPRYLRNVMRESPIYTRYSSEHKLSFLQFILADRRYSDLSDLQLLPLEDETFRAFGKGYPNYICMKDEMKMFPGIEQNFVKLDIAQTILNHLNEMQREGIYDLRNLNHEGFLSLLGKTLSANGNLRENGCLSIITNHITIKWLDKVYGYIRQHEIPLEKVENMFLVPVMDDPRSEHKLKLLPLKGRYVVANCDRMNRLDQNLSNALSNLNFTVLEHIPKGETYTELMGTYCKYPDLEGIFELLEGLHDDCKESRHSLETTVLHFNKRSNHKDKAALLNFLSKDRKTKRQQVDNLIRQLDIFPETSNVDNDVKYISILKNGRIACRNCIPVKYHAPLLHLNIPQKNLAERLGATEVSEGKIVEGILRAMVNSATGYKRPCMEHFMKYVLENFKTFGVNQTNILDLGSRIEFIEISTALKNNEVAPIGRFFDHTDRNLQELFHFDKSKFLPTKYHEKDLEPALRKLGLKLEKDVKIEDVHHVVQMLDRECRKKKHVDKKKLNKCSLQVMKLLEKMTSKSGNNLDSFHLESYRWITFIRNKPSHYPNILPWYGDQFESLLCSPEDIYSNKHELLSASVKCIVETSNHPYLAERYGWTNPPSVEICLLQLEAVKVFCIKQKATLMFMMKCIYQQMFDHIESSVERLKLPFERLKTQAIVCTGEEFRLPEEVFISFPKNENIHLEPFMHKLPVEFSEFSSMFVRLGSTAELTVSSLKSILTTIKATTCTPQTKRDRQMVIRVLKYIALLKDADTSLKDVLVPVNSGKASLVLHPVEECAYCDKESSLLADIDGNSNVRFVHSDVSAELAESLGIQSFVRKYMSEGGMEEMYSACGQAEPLTTRLKHVLENYPDGLAVLKELVQNADDAGAQHICFLYDERQNKNARTGLIDENMAKCQGPALWAYNNAEFTEVDFQNIVKLGGETKKETKTKIGKFGLGFCAVYNLTDVPSFLSGSSLVIFDPHTTNLGKAIKDKNSPGIRMTFTKKNSGILKLWRNQFCPYNKIFGCDLSGGIYPPKFEGTLFRLPLRTKEQALKSAIKCTPYCRDDMVTLLHLLKDCAGSLLTFTQNIKEIKLFHLPEDSEDPAKDVQLIFSTDKKVIKTHPVFTNPADINVMKEVEKACSTKQAFAYTERISVKMHMPKNRFLSVERSYVKSSPWLVAWASGTGRVLLENSVRLESEGALPLGSIAVSLKEKDLGFAVVPFPHREKLPGFYNTSHLFCFLPLPVECKTPVHINGCFAVSSDRKDLVKRTSDEKGETKQQIWNRLLMSDAVCNAYLSMLTSLDHFEVPFENYSLLWPIRNENENSEGKSYLADAFCKKVISGDHKVFYTTIGHRASFRDCVFLDNGFRHKKKVGSIAFEICQRFYQGTKNLMDMSEPLYQQFCIASCKEELQQQTMTMETFFEEVMFPNITQIDGKKRNALVMFILKENHHHLHQLLISNPCIPVHPDDRLRLPNELVRPQSKVSALFCKGDGRFPSDTNQLFCSESILDILVELGMMDKTLTDELVVERATSIAKLSDPKEAMHRCRKLLAYLDREQPNCQQIINVLSSIDFIPSLQKPRHWPLSWVPTSSAIGKVKFCPPNQMFFPSQMYQIACTQMIADTEGLKSELKIRKILQLLGVRENVSHNDVEAQLLAISKVRCDDLSNMQRSTLHLICLSVYEFFNRSSNKLSGKYDDLPIIWMSNQLIAPSQATLDTFRGIDCTPAIYQLGTSDVTKYTHFLKCVGIQETLTKENVISAIAKVQKDNKSQCSENVKLTVNLLQLLVLVCERFGLKLGSEDKSRIFVPDDANVFRLADDLCVDDKYPLKRQPFMHFVNMKISGDIIKLLDIKSKRVKHLNSIKGSMPFGQKENLVKRLKGILEGYPRDEAILYELLQNADDAGATEIMFIEDMRQHEAKKGIFGETWSAIQGPALCVFNDSCFNDEDLQGICKLGEGSKSQDPTKTGQFGIGFNVVYHLTDAPSFITRGPTTPNQGTFCMFDPHCKFCPVAEDNPGLQLPDLKELKETYPGVYECYLQKELPRKQGTWFRFPLRNKEMARKSLICNKPMHSKVLKELLQQFRENMKKCLLFLRNVRKISLCEVDKQGNITTNNKVESRLNRNDERNLEKFFHKCDALTKALHDRSVDLQNIEMQTVKYIMTIHPLQPERWIIAQTFGLDSKAKLPDSVRTAFQCGDIALTPKGAVALPCISQERDAGARTEAKYEYCTKRFNTPIPKYHDRQGVAQLLEAGSSSKRSKVDGQAFCFLPLPFKTGLPVHVNGHFALVQTRGSLWDKTHRGDWNRLLFETAISNSYVLAIEYLRDTLLGNGRERLTIEDKKSSLEKYHQVFPRYEEGKNDLIKNMITSLFTILYENESTVFPVLSQNGSQIWWVALQKRKHEFHAYFNNLPDQFQPANEPNIFKFRVQSRKEEEDNVLLAANEAHRLSNTLIDIGMKLLESPLWIFNSMVQALQNADNVCGDQSMSEKHLVHPNIVIQFLRTYTSSPDVCLLEHINCRVTDTPVKSIEHMECLLRYCLKDLDNFQTHMEQLPLLVTNDDILRRFSPEQPVFLSPFCDLLPKSAKELVHRNLVTLLHAIQLQNCQCLKSLDLNSFSQMLPHNFDMAELSGQTPIQWDKQTLSVKWIREFWQYMDTLENVNFRALGNCCLIPGELKMTKQIDCRTEVLVPCDKGYVLLDNSSFENEFLREALGSLNIPTPHIPGYFSKTLRDMVASQQDPVRLVQCLHYHRGNLKYLEIRQCKLILEHLSRSDNISKLRGQSSVVNKIRDLPLFTTVNGKNVIIQTLLTEVYIVRESCNLPKDGIDSWATKCGCTLLEENYFTSELMSYLNCNKTISVPELYCRYILPQFHHLQQNHHLTHLTYVRHMLRDDPNCPFKEALRTSEFIYHEGSLKRANCFYSPHNRLCKKLCDQSMLPPYPFGNEEWNTLMVCAGMKETVSEDLFITFAKQIENNARSAGITKEIRENSREIVKFLFDTKDFSTNAAFLETIKSIRFIEPYVVQQVYQEIWPQFGCENLIQFCDSVPQYLSTLVWTNTSVLPSYVHTNLIGLGILREPPLRKVLSHTHSVCDSINKKLQDKKKKKGSKCAYISESVINKLMTKIYEYLQVHCIGNPESKRMLSETPLVHIKEEEIFVIAKQISIAFDGKKPIPPYLVEFPLQYGRYKELFQFIGTTDSVTLSQYSEVLLRIKAEVKSNMLGPDHIRDVLTAVRSIMTLLEGESLADIKKSMEEVDTLFLPTSEKRLAKSTDLVFADKPKLRSRVMQNDDIHVMFMHSLKDCHQQENLILNLPENLKPRVLSSIVQECLLSSSNNIKRDSKVEQLGAFLASSRFLNVIKKIGKLSDDDFVSNRQRLLRIQLVSLSEITTFLTVDGRRISGTEAMQECFYLVENGEPKLYFVANDQGVRQWLQDVGQKLSGTLSDCLDNKIAPEQMRVLVDYMDDQDRFKKYCDELLDEKENDEDESLAYFPGKLVPLGLHELLENELTLLKVGDLVAYEKFDPLIDGDETDSSTGAVFIFSRIIKILPAASQNDWLQKYEVNFGQGITDTVVRLRLYKVKYPETSESTELVLHQFGHDGATPLKRDNIFDEIIHTLSEAWKLDNVDRKRIMKRLLLIWHPDKNCGKGSTHHTFCKDVTQFILDIMRRLDEGEQFGTTRFSSMDGQNGGQKMKRNYSDWRYGKCSRKLKAFGDRVSSIHRENQKHFTKSYAGKGRYVPNPQPAEAKRWFRQAEMDFKCGVNSLKLNSTAECCCQSKEDYNWICFKFHQACEKACKAYMYCIDERKVTHSHNLPSIVPSVAGNEQLAVWLQAVETLVGNYSRMRYPDVMDFPKIPGTSYTAEQATTLKDLTAKIMEDIENKL